MTNFPFDPGEKTASEVEAAARRLALALDALEAAVDRRGEADRGEDELAARIQSLGIDRSRLANDLDASLAHARALDDANREIARRVDAAIGAIRTVLETGETP